MKKSIIFFILLPSLTLLPGCMAGKEPAGNNPGKQHNEIIKKQGHLQNLGNGTCLDLSTGKTWQLQRSRRVTSLAEAEHYTKTLRLAGHDDWRLPTLAELYELFLLYDSRKQGNCPMTFEGNYWSADVDKKGRVGAWELDGDCRPEREYIPKKSGYIRAVRP